MSSRRFWFYFGVVGSVICGVFYIGSAWQLAHAGHYGLAIAGLMSFPLTLLLWWVFRRHVKRQ